MIGVSNNQQDIISDPIAFVSVNSDFINASKCELLQKSFTQGQPTALFAPWHVWQLLAASIVS